MRAVKKTGKTKRLSLLIFVIFFALTIFLLPHIDLKWIRERIAVEASSKLNGNVVISQAFLSIFPWPHITLKEVRIQSPQWGELTSEEMGIYPRIAPLFKKKVALKRFFLKGPVLDLTLAEGAMSMEKDIFPYLEQGGVRMIPSLEVAGGRVNVWRPGEEKPFFKIQGVEGGIIPREGGAVGLELRFSCSGAARVELRACAWPKGERNESFFLITGTDVKVEEIRRVALKVMGKDETVKEIFHILQGGVFSQIVCYGEGEDIREALDVERNVRICGTLSEGKVLVPAGPLPLEGVSGEVEVSQAVMRGWDVEARLGRSMAREGKLVIGLTAERDIFHLEAELEADPGDIVHYLPMVLKEEKLRLEIMRFREAEGWVRGRLVLGENINDIRPWVEIDDFQVSFCHGHSPRTISLDGGNLSLRDGKSIWRADAIRWESYRWSDAEGTVTFDDQGIEITVARADLYGIDCQGTISQREGMTTLAFRFWAKGVGLAPTISCLWGKEAHIEGNFLLEGDIEAKGKEDPLREGSQGSLLIHSQKGRIYRWTILSRIFSSLNVMEFFKGSLPDFTQKGFQYDKLTIKGDVKDGYLCLEEAVIDGAAMKIVGEGKIDLLAGEANLVVLMAPLKTVDTIINHIPIVGKILTGESGTFISVPFSVKGPLDDPKITPLPPSAVGAGLWGLLKRTLQAPVELIKSAVSKK